MEERGQKKVDFLRMDIEGFECDAYFGMEGLVRNNPDLIISFEWQRDLMRRYSAQDELYRCLVLQKKAGYTLWYLTRPFAGDATELTNNELQRVYPEQLIMWHIVECILVKDLK
jgi:hypothetical protein